MCKPGVMRRIIVLMSGVVLGQEGGGVLVNQAVHELDLLSYFMGRVESVYGIWRNVNHPYIEVDDTAQGIVTFESGATATILVSNSVNPAQSAYVHIVGTNGHTFRHSDSWRCLKLTLVSSQVHSVL